MQQWPVNSTAPWPWRHGRAAWTTSYQSDSSHIRCECVCVCYCVCKDPVVNLRGKVGSIPCFLYFDDAGGFLFCMLI